MSKVSKELVTMLSTKYEFDMEEALKYVEENVKIVDKKGRPKKEKKVVEVSGKVDIFTTLVEGTESSENKEETPKKMTKKAEKEAKKLEKETAKAQKEAEKQAKEEAKAQKAAEKLAKSQKEKKPRTEAQIAAFEKMKAKGEEKRKQKALEKEQGVVAPVTEPVAEVAAPVTEPVKAAKTKKTKEVKTVVEETKEEVKVKKFEVNGKKYLKSSENILYDAETQDVIGKWNEDKKEIIFEELEEEEDQE
jgi:colicin import membrane protein